MKLSDRLMLAAILSGLAFMFFMTHIYKPERVRPGSPEYEAYIQYWVEECVKAPARFGIAEGLAPAELEAACRAATLKADRFDPSARPLKN
jgi:hypothetical protein